jgi:uncharacterized protein (TIGR03083 family)
MTSAAPPSEPSPEPAPELAPEPAPEPAPDLGQLYRDARERISRLVDDEVADLRVPATPEWTVREVVAHLRGVVEDVLSANTAGAATDPWTAAQVERGRQKSVAQLLGEWAAEAPLFEAFLSSPDGAVAARAVFDVHTHECDLAGALGAPRPSAPEFESWAFREMSDNLRRRLEELGLPPLQVTATPHELSTHELLADELLAEEPMGDEPDDVGPHAGAASAGAAVRVARHEFIRAYLGRRSPDQVRSWAWSGDPAPYLPHFAVFGPRDTPLVD